MYKKVLVANRGEIALRIMRACKELGISTVAIFSEADADAPHVAYADEAYNVGPATATKSYLNVPAVMEAAMQAGADAIHPGYGFLAENSHFAAVCKTWGIDFIGPDPEAIEKMGFKSLARETMRKAGVPVIPGTDGTVDSEEEALAVAEEIGYPVLVKAAAGGGGRGIRIARDVASLKEGLAAAQREAVSSFGNGALYVEKYLEWPRHVEFQILADRHGNVLHLYERESSLQRRRQKILEEAPSPALTPELRTRMAETAVEAARAVHYTSAGTVEFLVDREGNYYFIEMNTRIQVEHPCTEWITGIDIVKEQIRAAAGEPLTLRQEDIQPQGWAIEFRINAEDPDNRFMPSPGTITAYELPRGAGVRVDDAAFAGYTVQPYYDSLIAKLIVWGRDREEALARSRRALDEYQVEGIKTTIPLHKKILEDENFQQGSYHTRYLEDTWLGK